MPFAARSSLSPLAHVDRLDVKAAQKLANVVIVGAGSSCLGPRRSDVLNDNVQGSPACLAEFVAWRLVVWMSS